MAENLDGPMILQWARRAAAGLRERQAEINRLNVFPIPDADTGSNMAHTMSAAFSSSQSAADMDAKAITAALAQGAVRGARGNSGMVLSQVFRALADTASLGPVDGTAVAKMLHLSVDFVRNSIAAPVEGTILTVLRAAAEGAQASKATLKGAVAQALSAAEAALEQTPHQLEALAQAGVVDAGGRGLVVILQSLLDTLNGASASGAGDLLSAGAVASEREKEGVSPLSAAGGAAELEVMFLFTADNYSDALKELRGFLERAGTSLMIVEMPQGGQAKVHIHTRCPAAVIERAYALGNVAELRLEVLPESPVSTATPIIALTSGGAAAEVFEAAGAIPLDLDNISDEELRCLMDTVTARSDTGGSILLSNGRDVTRILSLGQPISVVETTCLAGGLAALAVHDPHNAIDEDVEDMTEAVLAQRSCTSTADSATEDLARLLADGGELLTLLWSAPDITATDIQRYRDYVRAIDPAVEFHAYQADGMGHALEIGVE